MDLRRYREEREKDAANDKLLHDSSKKITTTMVGALASIEKHFGFLWDSHNEGNAEEFLQIYKKLREEILDKGHDQIWSLEKEFKKYDINFKRYYMKLPFKDKG